MRSTTDESYPDQVYCDGGLAGPNPSPIGGTWAYVWVKEGVLLHSRCGRIQPADLGLEKVTNNHMELLAAILALESVPDKWGGMLVSDSAVTLTRLRGQSNFTNTPRDLMIRAMDLSRRKRPVLKHIKGHPTQRELKKGLTKCGEHRVSEFNVLCDELCQGQARLLMFSAQQAQ